LALNRGYEYREQIGSPGGGRTVLDHLTQTYRHSTETDWRDRLENGEIYLDGLKTGPDRVLRRGQWLVWRRPPWNEPEVPLAYAVLHKDQDLLAVAKPCGLPTLPAGGFLEHTLLTLVRKSFPEAAPLHRLGRGTSGVVLFARTATARSVLCAALRHNEITKIYRALASGIPALDSFTIEAPIGQVPHPKLGTLNAVCHNGKRALSRVTVIERRSNSSLVEIRIETGRPHQIRIHLAAAGHPLVGDPLYVVGGRFKETATALPGDSGYLLHSESVRVLHPTTGKPFEVWCSPPPGLALRDRAGRSSPLAVHGQS
jgi:23S rRNA pseudouridine1911/1915/1917 synthase